jgi:hypothetical protein
VQSNCWLIMVADSRYFGCRVVDLMFGDFRKSCSKGRRGSPGERLSSYAALKPVPLLSQDS